MSAPTAPGAATLPDLPTDEHYARNLVDGAWGFPAAPYEFEIRNPLDSTITTVVPLSSRFDVARAVAAAAAAAPGWAADRERREELLSRLAETLTARADDVAALQALETGIDVADARAATAGIAAVAHGVADRAEDAATPGVTGHVLSWGLPLLEVLAAVGPQLAVGRTVVVKPSLRAPMSAVVLAHLATEIGFPPGVVNVVQGTAEDVGAALCGSTELVLMHVRGSSRTLDLATRAQARTGVPVSLLPGGGNVAVVGPDTGEGDLATLAGEVARAVRVNSAGGPLGLPVLAVHESRHDRVVDAVLAALADVHPAPLPTEPLRRRTIATVEELRGAGLTVRAGGALPDDVRHRMGWVVPPTVLTGATLADRPEPGGPAPRGPVLDVRTWRAPQELGRALTRPRHRSGTAAVWGLADDALAAAALPHALVLRGQGPASALAAGRLADAWSSPTTGSHS